MPRRLPALPVAWLRQGAWRMGPDGAVLQLHPRAEHPRPEPFHGLLGQAPFKLGDFAALCRHRRRRTLADRQAASPRENQPQRGSYPPHIQLRSVIWLEINSCSASELIGPTDWTDGIALIPL